MPRIERLSIDTWAGKQIDHGGLDLGIGLVWPRGRWRPGLQVAQDRAGFCVGWRIVPVLDLTVGVQGIWDLRTGSLRPGIYLSLFRF